MSRKLTLTTLALFVALAPSVWAQPVDENPSESRPVVLEKVGVAPTVFELAAGLEGPVAFGETKEVPIRVPDFLLGREPFKTDRDPLSRPFFEMAAPTASISVEGYSSDDNFNLFGFRIMPPDTEGDVGQDFYVQYNNLGWRFYDKANGALAGGPFPGNIFWQGFGGVCETNNAGDPIVLYDHIAGQWVFSQFTDPGNPDGHQCFAVTVGSNPAGPYFLYDFIVSPGQFNDYPKISMWSDGAGQSSYHMTTNEFAGSFAGVNLTAFDRDAMLVGAAAQGVQFSLPFTGLGATRFSLQPSHLDGGPTPPHGTCAKYIQVFDDETWGAGGANGPDGYQFWELCVDWNNPPASTLATGPFVQTAVFDSELCGFSRDCIPQPGTTQRLDVLGQFTMYRFGTRFFPGDGLRGVINHTVDLGGDLAGIRWAQFDIPSLAGVSITDTGTLDVGDGRHRWMGSATLDGAGNMGLVYTRSGTGPTDFPSVYFTGRETSDPPGTLQSESSCIDGTGVQLGGNRWGDYAAASVDPVDECTFWVTNEYVETTGNFQWDTRICAFEFPSCGGGGVDPVTVTLTSIAAEDGWVRESNENSNVGGRANAGGAGRAGLRAGDATRDRQYKLVVSFDTSSIPATATIQSATLRLMRGRVTGSNPFTSGFAPLTADIVSGSFGGNPALTASDFEAAATATGVANMSSPPANNTFSEGALDAAGLAAINTSGRTQLRLSFQLDDNDDGGNDFMGFFPADNNNSSRHPQLVVTYVP